MQQETVHMTIIIKTVKIQQYMHSTRDRGRNLLEKMVIHSTAYPHCLNILVTSKYWL